MRDNNTPISVLEKTYEEQKRTDVLIKDVSRETILSGGNVKKMYKLFRKDGMNRIESLYNAIYLASNNKYNESETNPKNEYVNVPNHPHYWSQDKKKMHKHNKWSVIMSILNGFVPIHKGLVKIGAGFSGLFKVLGKIPKSMDNSLRASRTLARVTTKVVLPVFAVFLAVFTITTIAETTDESYAVGVYINGEYVGNTLDVNEIVAGKHAYEDALSNKYGVSVVLDCEIGFKPQTYDESTVIAPGDTSIYSSYMTTFTKDGYGLYIDNDLAAVSEVEKWLTDAVDEYLLKYVSKDVGKAEKSVINNNITVIADKYPQGYFLDEQQIRQMFMLDSANKSGDSYNLDYSNVITSGDGIELTPPVTVDVAVEREEFSRASVPHTVITVEDDTLLQGMRRLVSSGKDGEKRIKYKSKYLNGKLVSQEIVSEELISEPVDRVVKIGVKVPTDEEIALIPTGTYIYPATGYITSKYGWRKLYGQNNFHQALDIASTRGTAIVASDGGEVVDVGYTKGYGKYCIIRHNDEISTRYAHCDTIEVEVGELVGQGFIIATMGDTGVATGVHVHFEVIKDGATVDPLTYLEESDEVKWNLLS